MKVLICPDKFKGSLTATEAAECIRQGWLRSRPKDEVDILPISDGGDGFGELLGAHMGARAVRTRALNAAYEPCWAKWWWHEESRTAIIESARVIGLAMLPAGKHHPFHLDTRGLADVLLKIAEHHPSRTIVGVGGSATNDGGFGLARGLGWKFFTGSGQQLDSWATLDQVKAIKPPPRPLSLGQTLVAVDVANPLLGARGCSRIYGPQKGLKPAEFGKAEAQLTRLAAMIRKSTGKDFARTAGAGAAGGLGFGMLAFCGARLEPGFDLFVRTVNLGKRIHNADVVIAGEGSIDDSSFMGKGVGQLVEMCGKLGIPCLAVGGRILPKVRRRFHAVADLSFLFGPERALSEPKKCLRAAAAFLAQQASIPIK